MININKKSFSLAELLISLLVTSMILAAILPTISKNLQKAELKEIWRWNSNGNIYAANDLGAKAGIGTKYISKDSVSLQKLNISNNDNGIDSQISLFQDNSYTGTIKLTANYNIAIGYDLLKNISNTRNIAIGANALSSASYTTNNLAIGNYALKNLSTGNSNVAIGNYALNIGNSNILKGNTTIGHNNLKSIRGSYNTAIGYNIATNNSGASSYNIIVGYNAAPSLNNGEYNTIIGAEAGNKIRGGNYNIIIGHNSGSEIVKNSNNICIGSGACKQNDASNVFEINNTGTSYLKHTNMKKTLDNNNKQYLTFNGTFYDASKGNATTEIDEEKSGNYFRLENLNNIDSINLDNIGIDLKNAIIYDPKYSLERQIYSKINITAKKRIKYDTGGQLSDIRLKNVIGDSVDGIDKINQIQVKKYIFKDDKTKKIETGVIAQELQKIFPNSVSKGSNGFLYISTDEIFYAMLNSLKDLYGKINIFDKRIAKIEKDNKQIEHSHKELKEQIQKQNKKIDEKYNKLDSVLTELEQKIK